MHFKSVKNIFTQKRFTLFVKRYTLPKYITIKTHQISSALSLLYLSVAFSEHTVKAVLGKREYSGDLPAAADFHI